MASNKRSLKAYVRYDGTGRVIAGGPILSRFKPKVGNWVEVDAYECCNPTTSTTTTTTCPCNTWELVGISGAQFQVTDCNGLPSVVIVGNGQMISTCCQNVLLISGEGTGTATNLHDCCPPGK